MKDKEETPPGGFEPEDGGKSRAGGEDALHGSQKSPSHGEEDDAESERKETVDKKSGRLPHSRLILLGGSLLAFLLLSAVGAYLVKEKRAKPPGAATAKVKYITRIIRPVPPLDNRVMLDFLITYEIQGRDMITALRMEAGFHSLGAYQNFKKNPVAFREAVYNFLLAQNAADNTAQTWRSVFGKNLLNYLKVKLPGSCPDTIRMTQVENL